MLGWPYLVSCVIGNRFACVSSFPKACRNREWIDLFASPPGALIAPSVKLAMMEPADRNSEAIAYLAPHCLLLRKLDVVRIGRRPTANKARLGAYKS